jgi:hypothetical protein
MSLQDVFPGLKNEPGLAIPLAPIDGFLGISASADAANLAATEAEYRLLSAQIRSLEPNWSAHELEPLGSMSWQGRANAINNLRMERAVAYYTARGDIRPLQVETLSFLQQAVDTAYDEAETKYSAGDLTSRLSRGEAIGNFVDRQVRNQLRQLFNVNGISFGSGGNITINNRDVSTDEQSYRIPDARLGNVSFDWSLVLKTISSPQIRGFFLADSKPDAVVIVRPSQLGRDSTYLIPRPADLKPRR